MTLTEDQVLNFTCDCGLQSKFDTLDKPLKKAAIDWEFNPVTEIEMSHDQGKFSGLFMKDKNNEELVAFGELGNWKTIKLDKDERIVGIKYKSTQ